jgi:3-methylcrotonyl-CoA carboxylase alpha subunit
MIKKILIANRGEIACRIIKTAKKMGVSTVAVYSDADMQSVHVKMADESVYIGTSTASESYLNIDKILTAIKETHADAVHPGYGFLSENVVFREACDTHNIIFIGPSTEAIVSMGSKSAAKKIMGEASVPLVPGYHEKDQDPAILKAAANTIGYPVLLKASAGGGGKGMRQVWSENEFDQALESAKRESLKFFGNDDMLVEKYLMSPRHVEVQIFCDQHNNAVYLADRDCSVQRRHQKIIEEAPAPNISDATRREMGETAVRAAKAINYHGAGTIEFLLDADGYFYFMEMNTRLQVEHPVTEMVTRQDLVEWQINVANGERLPLLQQNVVVTGHAFEARIYAEDPENNFLPASGLLSTITMPEESAAIRVDTGVTVLDDISVFYDPMIAKLIVWGEDREKALAGLQDALRDCHISRVKTNLQFLYKLSSHAHFLSADIDTGFIEKHHDSLFNKSDEDQTTALILHAVYSLLVDKNLTHKSTETNASPWDSVSCLRLNQSDSQLQRLCIGGEIFDLIIYTSPEKGEYAIQMPDSSVIPILSARLDNNQFLSITLPHQTINCKVVESAEQYHFYTDSNVLITDKLTALNSHIAHDDSGEGGGVIAPLNGTVVTLLVEPMQTVKKGDTLMIVEAMKMEHSITAPDDGRVVSFHYTSGDLVASGQLLLEFKKV